ncbi:hypothetical protein OK351_15995 [Glutamicibacter sp. MNS18]|uniref:hypothetical protein n=1 Tax=Glutamicibacter sp. MNS18 TaxID=2989817 RepID=UPI002235D8B5|nr:hypothetical protein [Glutamicibacter sp. MNS18]MCW4466988.1 hypothetical protein [Glutamicibacter sp. MNS18]
MNQKDQTPSNTPDPQWDDLVARLQQGPPADPDAVPEEKPDAGPVPHEPTAADREKTLHDLFNTGPLARGPRDYEVEESESDGGFVPEEPPALGFGDPVLTLSWVAVAGGSLGLLLCVVFFRNAPGSLYALLAVMVLVGVAMLFRRLPKHRDPGDDGARV